MIINLLIFSLYYFLFPFIFFHIKYIDALIPMKKVIDEIEIFLFVRYLTIYALLNNLNIIYLLLF